MDFNALEQYGVRFLHYPGTNKRSVSELVISLALSLLRRIPLLNHEVKGGQWSQLPGTCLSEKTFGILGMGHVGENLAKLLVAFDCEVLYQAKNSCG